MGGVSSKGPSTFQELKSLEYVTLVDILRWQKNLLLNNKDKKSFTQSEFIKYYQDIFPTGDAKTFAKNVFRILDIDGNGTVDFNEFIITLSALANDDLERKIDWTFQYYDVNGDGYITREEFRNIVGPLLKMQAKGKLKQKDIDEQANDLFRRMNADGDVGISLAEFRTGCAKFPFLYNNLRLN